MASEQNQQQEPGTRKIVINGNYGGFNLSTEAIERLITYGVPVWNPDDFDHEPESGVSVFMAKDGHLYDTIFAREENRAHPLLVRVVEELGKAASSNGNMVIVEIPADVDWTVEEYDGFEWVAERHRKWFADEGEEE